MISARSFRLATFRIKRARNRFGNGPGRMLVSAFVVLLHAWLFTSWIGTSAEFSAYDLWFRLRPSHRPPSSVVIVTMDEVSEQKLSVSPLKPWPRALHTELLQRLENTGIKLVFFDRFFVETDENPLRDIAFAESMRRVPTVIGKYTTPAQRIKPDGTLVEYIKQILPAKIFMDAARHVASLQLWDNRDADRVIRHISNFDGPIENRIPMVSALLGNLGSDPKIPAIQDLINYYGPPRTIATIPYYQALDEKSIPSNFFKDKIVFVGVARAASYLRSEERDTFKVPVSDEMMSGVEIHATIASNLLERRWMQRFTAEPELLILSILAFFFTYALIEYRPAEAAMLLVGVVTGWSVVAFLAFSAFNTFIPGVVLFLLVLPGVFSVGTLLGYLRLTQSLAHVENALGTRIQVSSK